LQLLHATDLSFGIQDDNLDTLDAVKAGGNRAAGVARCCDDHNSFLCAVRREMPQASTHKSRADILKRERGAVEKFES
jgi:hypothetical protein